MKISKHVTGTLLLWGIQDTNAKLRNQELVIFMKSSFKPTLRAYCAIYFLVVYFDLLCLCCSWSFPGEMEQEKCQLFSNKPWWGCPNMGQKGKLRAFGAVFVYSHLTNTDVSLVTDEYWKKSIPSPEISLVGWFKVERVGSPQAWREHVDSLLPQKLCSLTFCFWSLVLNCFTKCKVWFRAALGDWNSSHLCSTSSTTFAELFTFPQQEAVLPLLPLLKCLFLCQKTRPNFRSPVLRWKLSFFAETQHCSRVLGSSSL